MSDPILVTFEDGSDPVKSFTFESPSIPRVKHIPRKHFTDGFVSTMEIEVPDADALVASWWVDKCMGVADAQTVDPHGTVWAWRIIVQIGRATMTAHLFAAEKFVEGPGLYTLSGKNYGRISPGEVAS